MELTPLTQEQKIVLTAFTGIMCTSKFGDFQKAVDDKLGVQSYTHHYASKEFWETIKEAYKEDFMKLCDFKSEEEKGTK